MDIGACVVNRSRGFEHLQGISASTTHVLSVVYVIEIACTPVEGCARVNIQVVDRFADNHGKPRRRSFWVT
jgi:hypothetical protein